MNRINTRLFGDANDGRNIEISSNRFPWFADLIGLIRLKAMQGIPIFISINGHGSNMQFVSRPADSNGDLATIGDQQFLDGLHAKNFFIFSNTMSGAIQQTDSLKGYLSRLPTGN